MLHQILEDIALRCVEGEGRVTFPEIVVPRIEWTESFEVPTSRVSQLFRTAAAVLGPMSRQLRQSVDAFVELNQELENVNAILATAYDQIDAVEQAFQAFQASNPWVKTDAEKRAEALLLRHLTREQARIYRATGTFLLQGSRGTVYRILSERSINVETVTGPCPSEVRIGNLPGEALREAGGLRVNGRLLRSKRRRIRRKVARRSAPVRCCLGLGHRGGHLWRPDSDAVDWGATPRPRDRRLCLEMPGCPLPDQLLAQKLLIEDDEGDFIARAREWHARTMTPIVENLHGIDQTFQGPATRARLASAEPATGWT